MRRDLRLVQNDSYSGYNLINLKSYLGANGDCYDRFLIRMLEMGESLAIVNFTTQQLLRISRSSNSKQFLTTLDSKLRLTKKSALSYNSMEDLILHFIH